MSIIQKLVIFHNKIPYPGRNLSKFSFSNFFPLKNWIRTNGSDQALVITFKAWRNAHKNQKYQPGHNLVASLRHKQGKFYSTAFLLSEWHRRCIKHPSCRQIHAQLKEGQGKEKKKTVQNLLELKVILEGDPAQGYCKAKEQILCT